MKPFSFDHLNETEFEEFCYDLLSEMGFKNISWRKGTGLKFSPADRGRDIECFLEITDVDGNKYLEKWFVQCKHYLKGVPPTKIQGILAWATAENPDKVLIMVSNFLSNPAKDYLEEYKRTNKPRFKIKVWERPDLEKLTADKSRLLRKYKIASEFSYLSILHPAHILYMKGVRSNSLDYLFEILDKLDSEKRDEVLGWTYIMIIRPRFREPISGKETFKELRIDDVSYDSFKKICNQITAENIIDEHLLVFWIVNFTLQYWIAQGNKTSIDEFIHNWKQELTYFQNKMKDDAQDKDTLKRVIKFTQDRIKNARKNIYHNYELYEYFCVKIVAPLLLERLFSLYEK